MNTPFKPETTKSQGKALDLGLGLIVLGSLLLGIWAVKDTIALRNILLVTGALLSCIFLCLQYQASYVKKIGFYWLPIIFICTSLIWVFSHYWFFSISPEIQLNELTSIWMRSALATVLGFALGVAFMKHSHLILLFWGAVLVDFFILFAQYLPFAIEAGGIIVPLNTEDFRRYLFIGKINPMYLGVLLIAGSSGMLLDAINSKNIVWIQKIAIFWLASILTVMYAFAFIINTRSGIFFGSLIVFIWLIYGVILFFYRKESPTIFKLLGARQFIYALMIALVLISIFAYQQIQRDSGWGQLLDDIKIGYQVEKYPHWQNKEIYGFPTNHNGQVVTFNTYERVAWATAGIKSIPYHPYGVGILLLPLGLAGQELFPGITPISTHSGWVDLTLAFGIPFITLIWLALVIIFVCAIKQQSPFKFTIINLSVILFSLFMVGELSNGHNLEMLFYFLSLMSGMQVAQIKVSIRHSD